MTAPRLLGAQQLTFCPWGLYVFTLLPVHTCHEQPSRHRRQYFQGRSFQKHAGPGARPDRLPLRPPPQLDLQGRRVLEVTDEMQFVSVKQLDTYLISLGNNRRLLELEPRMSAVG